MKGIPVLIIFISINMIALIIFGTIFTGSMRKSVSSHENMARESLIKIISVYDEKNIAVQRYISAVSEIPKIDSYILSSFSNYINKTMKIPADESLIEKPLTFQEYQYLQARIQEKVNQINNIARNYPMLRTNKNYIEERDKINNIEKMLRYNINIYNEYVSEYNKLTSRPPASIVSGFMGKFPFQLFQTGTNITEKSAHLFE